MDQNGPFADVLTVYRIRLCKRFGNHFVKDFPMDLPRLIHFHKRIKQKAVISQSY